MAWRRRVPELWRRRRRWIIAGGVALAAVLIVLLVLLRPKTVAVVYPVERDVVQSITASGQIAGAQESVLAPQTPGVLAALSVGEGDAVSAGQVIARVSSPELLAQLEQADAAVSTAITRVQEAEAQAGVTQAQIRQARAETAQAVRQAEVRVAQAERDVARARSLAASPATAASALRRAQANLNQAEAAVAAARANLDSARTNLDRVERLAASGAVAQSRLDEARTAQATATANLNEAIAQREAARTEVQNQQELLATSRTAQVEQAETALAAARADLAAARRAGAERVSALEQTPTIQRITTARSQLVEAQRAREAVRARLAQNTVRAPYAGRITDIISQPGDVVGPSQGVARITQIQRPEAQVDIDERDIARIAPGQSAVLITDAYPEQQIMAVVDRIAPSTNARQGTVQVILVPTHPPPWLSAGYTVDATIIISPRRRHILVPTTAIMRNGDAASVFVVPDAHVVRRVVVTGTGNADGTIILSGVALHDRVVREPLTTREGQRARPRVEPYQGGR